MPYTTIYNIKTLKKCMKCKKKKSKILINQIVNNIIKSSCLCVPCFKEEMPHYTLEPKCFDCIDCFSCSIQKLLFTPKEIRQFKIKLI